MLFYCSHLNYFLLQKTSNVSSFMWLSEEYMWVSAFNKTSSSRNQRSPRIRNVTARTVY